MLRIIKYLYVIHENGRVPGLVVEDEIDETLLEPHRKMILKEAKTDAQVKITNVDFEKKHYPGPGEKIIVTVNGLKATEYKEDGTPPREFKIIGMVGYDGPIWPPERPLVERGKKRKAEIVTKKEVRLI